MKKEIKGTKDIKKLVFVKSLVWQLKEKFPKAKILKHLKAYSKYKAIFL